MDSKLEQAKEWAEGDFDQAYIHAGPRAAAEVIQSLPDQWIDAGKVRALMASLNAWADDADAERSHGRAIGYRTAAKNLSGLLPTPALPTLADMTPEEREACRWMQAQTWHEVGIIIWMDELTEIAQLITRANGVLERKFKDVTPLPDLPKLEWPGSHADTITAESVEDVQAGRVADFEPALPRPEDVPSGEAWLIAYRGGFHTALKADDGDDGEPWIVSFTPGGAFLWLSDRDVTLISRLVPERKENA